ncbi:MAG: dipeptidase [Candidatus Bathyarchaeota archaeon]|nr:dipeptidase [Candidatus Bathyarchaeota archaeon]
MKKAHELTKEESDRALELHGRSIYIQALESISEPTPDFPGFDENYVAGLKRGGITAINATIAWPLDNFRSTVLKIIDWQENLVKLDDAFLATTAEDVERAKRDGGVGVFLGLQNSAGVEDDLRLLDALHQLGLKIVGLAYQRRNLVGDGCGERTDCGLSEFGVNLIGEMNRLGMLIDLSHVGRETAMDAIELSKDPVVFSHSNPRAMRDHVRNIDDEQMKAMAEKGGAMGICAFRLTLRSAEEGRPTVEDLLNCIDYAVDLIGVDHVGIGLDRGLGTPTVAHYEGIKRFYPELRTGLTFEMWAEGTEGANDPAKDINITRGLVARGYSDQEIEKILGLNFLGVFKQVFRG